MGPQHACLNSSGTKTIPVDCKKVARTKEEPTLASSTSPVAFQQNIDVSSRCLQRHGLRWGLSIFLYAADVAHPVAATFSRGRCILTRIQAKSSKRKL